MTSGPNGRLKVRLGNQGGTPDPDFAETLSLEAFASLIRSGRLLSRIGRYRDVLAVTPDIGALPRPFLVKLALRLLSRGACTIRDERGDEQPITWRLCFAAARRLLQERRAVAPMRARVAALLDELERMPARRVGAIPRRGNVLHVRTDLWLGIKVGGAIAHTAGIANAFAASDRSTTTAAFEPNPILSPGIAERLLPLPSRFWDSPELPAIAANCDLEEHLGRLIDEVQPSLIYHRMAAFSFVAALQARRRGLPLIIEYNGSEVWIARHWGRAFRNEALAERMELAVLRAADRIITVSAPLRDQLVDRGIEPDAIRMVMNGVDTNRFHPDLDAAEQRRRLGIDEAHVVIGFIGSFGVWHGVPMLIEAYAKLLATEPALRASTRLLLIGDGVELNPSLALIEKLGISSNIIVTGLVPQAQAPAMLAATDILAAPTQPNADGSAFFGSPTKIFEYMSMGRAIVATSVSQIADILEDDTTAVLVPPGDADAFARGLLRVVHDSDHRSRLGAHARQTALAHHDWRHRLTTILD